MRSARFESAGGEVTLAETEGTPEELDAVFERVVGRRLSRRCASPTR